MEKIKKKTTITKDLHIMRCGICYAIKESASKLNLLPEFTTCDCEPDENQQTEKIKTVEIMLSTKQKNNIEQYLKPYKLKIKVLDTRTGMSPELDYFLVELEYIDPVNLYFLGLKLKK